MSSEVISSATEEANHLVTKQPHRILLSAFNKLVVSSKELTDLVEAQRDYVIADVEEMLECQPSREDYYNSKAFANLYYLRDLYIGLLDKHRFFSKNAGVILSSIDKFYLNHKVYAIGELKQTFIWNIRKTQNNLTQIAEYFCRGIKCFK